MLDLKQIRESPKEIEARLQTKDAQIDLSPILQLDREVREVIQNEEMLQSRRNLLSAEIGRKSQSEHQRKEAMKEVTDLRDQVENLRTLRNQLEAQLHSNMSVLPNLPSETVPISSNPNDNLCIQSWGEKREFDFPYKNHLELNERLHCFDWTRGAKVSGSGWVPYRGMGARLEWALVNYMLDLHLRNGFEMWIPPHLVRPEVMYGSGQLPKFEKQLFQVRDEDYQLYLIPTSETVLNGLHSDEIFQEEELPKRYVSYTPCFRREAGAAGSQERGLIRMHQFNKVEMFAFTRPDQSDEIFQQMVSSVETILQGLQLHYRLMLLVTGETSFAAAKTVDVEVWLPGQNRYYEVSSISCCTDFQARRSKIRFRHKKEKPQWVHTLNGSGVATSRLMVSLLENHQHRDGSVALPLPLHPYMQGVEELCPI